ncbi:MAG: O-antigen ligase family protein, partial [Bryobacteraceae bacterium]|nr:O-antigen ligase family protein [Bryobacteraceae bacterium]
ILIGVLIGIAGSILFTVAATAATPIKGLIAILGLIAAIAMFLSPEIAVTVLCLSLPFERIGRLTDDADTVAVSASRILGLIALASLLLHCGLKKRKLYFELPLWLFGGYVVVGALTNAWALVPKETYRETFRIFGNLLFFFFIINVIRDYVSAKRAVVVWLIASLAAAGYSLGDYYYSRGASIAESQMGLQSTRSSTTVMDLAEERTLGTGVRRLFGTTAHPTLFGLNMTMTVPFLFWAIRREDGLLKVLWIGGLGLAVASILLSNTRAVLLLAVGTVIFCLIRGLWRPTVFSTLALAIAGLAAAPFVPKDVYKRILDPALYSSGKGDAIRVRFKLLEKSWDLIGVYWTRGIGVGNQTTLQEMVTDENTGYLSTQGLKASSHNEFVWVMVEVGIVGYVFFWSFVFLVTRASFNASSLIRKARGCADDYWFTIACQALLIGIPLFALQSETFHYPLKGWWLIAPIACTMERVARQVLRERERVARQPLPENVAWQERLAI